MAVWVNEIHYDNGGTDTQEGIEIAGTAGTDLTGWTIVFYNGTATPGAAVTYTPVLSLSGTIPNNNNSGIGTLWFPQANIQNGTFDGFALVNAQGAVVQFLSYEGVITASNGPATGMTSTDIGVSQSGLAGQLDTHTLQLQGSGDDYADFTWASPQTATRGATNTGQTFVAGPVPQSLAIGDAGVTEGNSGTTQISFTVTRANGTTGAVDATWTVSFGSGATAASAADFAAAQALTGTVSFADGETSKTIVLDVAGDTAIEETETFTVTLSAPTNGATLADATATGTITNDDFPVIPAASIADAAAVEGDVGVVNLVFTVTLSAAATGTVTVDFATSDGSAMDTADYQATSGTVTFLAGETSKTISVPVYSDPVAELRETLTVTLSNPAGATIADGSAVGTITDNDGPIYHALAGGAFSQNWNNTGLITADDDWSNVASIIGYRGDELTGATAVNPGTITGTSNVVDVMANQNTAGSTSGGVGEFQLADPTIGLQGSGTADAPHIVLYLDATGRQDVTVSYRLRDIESSTDNAVQPIALQYRVGGTGPWIDVPSAYVADATTGPSTLGPDTLVTAILPPEANNQPRLEVRIITANATGNDEWVGIDDIQVTSALGQPSLAIANSGVSEGNDGTTAITFTVTRAGNPQGAVTADYSVLFDGDASASDFDAAQALTGTMSFADGETTKTITLQIAGDVAPETDETFTVSLSNIVGGTSHDASATGTIVNDDGPPPSISIGDVSQAEGDAGSSTMTFTVTRTGGTQPFTVDYVTTGGNATVGEDYVHSTGTLTFAEGETTKTITVTVNGDTAGEPNETFNVQLFNPTGFAVIADGVGVGSIVNDDRIFIHDIQGTAYYSPILAAEGKNGFNVASTTTVIVQAVVTALDGDGTRQGFYITEETADWDAFAASSEGIFVMTRNDAGAGDLLSVAAPTLKVGDIVTVTAQVMEYQSFNTMPRTVLVNPTSIAVNGTAPTLPTLLLDASRPIPNSILTGVTPDYTDSADGDGDTFDASLYALSFFESVEGMLVTIPGMVVADGFVQTSGGRPYFKAYSTVHADADQINSRGGYTVAGDPPLSPPDTAETDDATTHGGRHLHDGDINPDIIEVDFSGFAMAAPAGLAASATMGDQLGDLTGIIEFDFTDLKLFVTNMDPAAIVDTVPVQETTALGSDTRALTVATFNVENLDPGDGAARFAAIANVIANNLKAPDIISIEEMQDNNGADPTGGTDASTTWQMLVDALNAAIPGAAYQWVDQAPSGSEGGEPGGNIRVGFLYNTNRVQLGDLPANATIEERRKFTDRVGDGVRDTGDRIAFSDNMVGSEINPADWSGTRLSLLGQFTFNGNTVYVTANHLPAKGGSGEFWQFNQNLETGDPDNSGWAKRNAVAQDIYAVLNHIEANSNGAGVVAGGDFNDFYFYRPMEVVTGHVLADGTARQGGARFDNLTVTELAEAERYTYTFDGRSQAIDHIIVNQKLSAVASYDIVHLNTGYNANGTGANADPSISDHDPAVASFDFRSFAEVLTGTAGADSIDGFAGNDVIVLNGGGDDAAIGGEGDDLIYYGGAFTNGDSNNGGAGFDTVGLFGNYVVTFDADDLVGIERVAVYGSAAIPAAGPASYELTMVDANVAAGAKMDITAASLAANESFVFNGTAETNGAFTVYGGAGGDRITGGGRGDYLIGNGGADELDGSAGNDHLIGGAGADQLRGGVGRDTFHFKAVSDSGTGAGQSDRILDFERPHDRIDLSALDAGAAAGDQAFTFIGGATFSGAGQVRSTWDAAENAWRVEGDIDGDGTADFAILVVTPAQTPLIASDFIL